VGAVQVLVVDDQEPFRRAAVAVIEATDGFAVAGVAQTGEESVEVVRLLGPDLVLMDVNLPGIDGVEATRRLLALPSPPVVALLSTYEEEDFADQARACGAVAYVGKSTFGPARLSQVWQLARRAG